MLNLTELRNRHIELIKQEEIDQLLDIAIAVKRSMVQCDAFNDFNDSEIIMTDGEYEMENAKLEELRKRVCDLLKDVELGDD